MRTWWSSQASARGPPQRSGDPQERSSTSRMPSHHGQPSVPSPSTPPPTPHHAHAPNMASSVGRRGSTYDSSGLSGDQMRSNTGFTSQHKNTTATQAAILPQITPGDLLCWYPMPSAAGRGRGEWGRGLGTRHPVGAPSRASSAAAAPNPPSPRPPPPRQLTDIDHDGEEGVHGTDVVQHERVVQRQATHGDQRIEPPHHLAKPVGHGLSESVVSGQGRAPPCGIGAGSPRPPPPFPFPLTCPDRSRSSCSSRKSCHTLSSTRRQR